MRPTLISVRVSCSCVALTNEMYTIDSVAASTFQINEVFTGYRQSADPASKQQVHEALNAALKSLPDWPAPGQY